MFWRESVLKFQIGNCSGQGQTKKHRHTQNKFSLFLLKLLKYLIFLYDLKVQNKLLVSGLATWLVAFETR